VRIRAYQSTAAPLSHYEYDKKWMVFAVSTDRDQAIFVVGMADVRRNSRSVAKEDFDFIDRNPMAFAFHGISGVPVEPFVREVHPGAGCSSRRL
jgi:hypothetical protein